MDRLEGDVEDRRGQRHTPRSLEVRDISTLPTRELLPHSAQQLQTAEAYQREAAKLQALAQEMERHLWACSEALEEAREREQQIQTSVNAASTPDRPSPHHHDLEQARLDIESYATVIRQMREDYLALMQEADDYVAAASILRGVEHDEPESHEE